MRAHGAPEGRSGRWRRRFLCAAPIAAIVVVALCLRLCGINFGLPALNDPDELMFELGALRMLRGGTLNPGWFGHPATTTMYMLALIDAGVFCVSWLTGLVAGPADFAKAVWLNPGWIILPGRVMIALCGMLTVGLTARLGGRLFDRRTGLLAAALLAINPVHVFWSQVIRSDIMASLFMLLCLLATLEFARGGKQRAVILAGLWLGLAVATKWPFAAAGLGMVGAVLLRIANDRGDRDRALRLFLLSGVAALCTLIVVSPFLVIDFPTAQHDLIGEVQPYHLGATGGSPFWNLGWYIRQPLRGGLGLAGLALTLVGLPVAVRHREARAILGLPAFGFLILLLASRTVWDRWALPLFPILSIVGACGAFWVLEKLAARFARGWEPLAKVVLAFACAGPLLLTNVAQSAQRLNDTRQEASRWMVAHIPPGKTVLLEHFGFDLVRRPNLFLFPAGAAGCLNAMALLKGEIAYSTVAKLRQARSNVDIGTVAREKLSTCRSNYVITTQFDRYKAERQRFPAEYAQYRMVLGGARQVAEFSPRPGVTGGPVTRIFRIH